MSDVLDQILPRVTKPARYTNGELNAVDKNLSRVDVKFALAFPDVYEIGMSNLGLRILYEILNRREDVAAERVFAPWPDMEAEMRAHSIPLFTLESHAPVHEFDILGFSLGYELTYTNVLNMLDLAGIPLRSSEREEHHSIVIAGGCCTYNPEPMSEFIDAFVIGEGEEVVNEVVEVFKEHHAQGRETIIGKLAEIEGIYVPSRPPKKPVRKRLVRELDSAPFIEKPIVPFIETVHDRVALEVMRGCSRGCRFCQAGMVYRPVRERSMNMLLSQAERLVRSTGYDEIGLLSLSTADYTGIEHLVHKLIEAYKSQRIGISLPSLRADAPCVQLASEIQKVRKSGLTLAPEAGTQRLRNVINKNVTENNLLEAVEAAFKHGWRTIKLYFMVGLPTETDEDVVGIAQLATKVANVAKQMKVRPTVNVSVSTFVPKPHTPFQWRAQDTIQEIERKQSLLRKAIKDRAIQLSWHDARASALEGVLSRGDRRVGEAIYCAWKMGCRFDAWHEFFSYDKWLEAFSQCGVDPSQYANRARSYDEPLPWDHIDCGISKRFLISEDIRANEAVPTPDCRLEGCVGCGIAVLAGGCHPVQKISADFSPTPSEQTIPVSKQPAQTKEPKKRLRIMLVLTKGKEVKYISHLDYFRAVETALRRARVPVAYTEGFNPHAKMSLGHAIGVGVTSDDERMILELTRPEELGALVNTLNDVLPRGIRVLSTEPVPQNVKSPLHRLNASVFHFTAVVPSGCDEETVRTMIKDMKSLPHIIVRRMRGDQLRETDIRPHLVSADVVEFSRQYFKVEATLMTGDSGGASPLDFVEALRCSIPGLEIKEIHRVKQLELQIGKPFSRRHETAIKPM